MVHSGCFIVCCVVDYWVNDIAIFEQIYQAFNSLLSEKYQFSADKQRYHTNASKLFFARQLEHKLNAISLRVAWSVTCWAMRAIQIARDLAQIINQQINHCDNPIVPELKKKGIGYNA